MKLGKYISLAISTLVVFMIGWITFNVFEWPNEIPYIKGIVSALILIILIIYLISTIIPMVIKSIKTIFKFNKEQGLWKILTLAFGIGMTVFAGLIAILSFVWIIFVLKDGLANTKFGGGQGNGFDNWVQNNLIVGKYYVAGDTSLLGGSALLSFLGFSSAPFGLLTTSFVFIELWCIAGIVFEVLKKVLGGNKNKNQDQTQVNNSNVSA